MSVHPNPRYHPSSVLLKSDPNSFSSEGVPLKQSLSRSLLLRYTSDPSAKITSKLNHEDFLVNRGPSSRHFSNNDKNPWWSKKPLPPPAPVNSMFSESRYKTELCRQFDEIGDCEYGDRCLFAHGFEELKAPNNRHPKFKTERCSSFHEYGFCSFGMRCSFIHEKEDPMQVIATLVEDVKGRGPVVTSSPAVDSIDQETGYVWGSQGRLPVFQRLTKVSLPGVN